MAKTIDQLQAEIEKKETQLSQERHKEQRLKNRLKYYEKGERGGSGQLAYSFDIALQNEFSLEENIALERQFLFRAVCQPEHEQFNVIYQTAEDGLGDTVKLRLSGAGGNTATKIEQAEKLILAFLADGKELPSDEIESRSRCLFRIVRHYGHVYRRCGEIRLLMRRKALAMPYLFWKVGLCLTVYGK